MPCRCSRPSRPAHVAVTSTDAVRGGEAAQVTFRVPTESATASTVRVTVTLPSSPPFAEVMPRSVPGWAVTTTTTALPAPVKVGDFTLDKAVSSVTWTAQRGSAIGTEQFQDFDLLVGPVPDAATVTFAATQVYSDGAVVQWNQPTPASGAEPEHPSPVLTIAAEPSPVAVAGDTDATARSLGAAGLAAGLLALVVVIVSLVDSRRRRRTAR